MNTVFQGTTKKGREIIIRYPEIGDVENMLNFINTISDEKTFITYQGEHETLKSETKYLKERLKDIKDKKVIHLMTFYGDEEIGSCDIKMDEKTEKHIGLFGLAVAKNFRGEGIGKMLMELTEKEAKKNIPDLKIATLQVYSTNSIARDLYKKMGFTEYGVLPEGIGRLGKFEDSVLMYKKLS